jgi:hypothetical protein
MLISLVLDMWYRVRYPKVVAGKVDRRDLLCYKMCNRCIIYESRGCKL